MKLNKFNLRDLYNIENSHFQENNILFENALNSITSTSRMSRPLVEDYFNKCTNYENANKYNINLITLLEEVLPENKSLYNKLEGIYINNIIPKLSNSNIKSTINIIESSSLKDRSILNELKEYILCDRIINNYKKIDSKFNIDKSILENKDIDECIYNICESINEYNISKSSKYSIALESLVYGFYKNGIDCPFNRILENSTNYFLSDNIISDKDYTSMKNVLTYNDFITEESKEYIKFFIQEDGNEFKKELKKLLNNKKLDKESYKLIKELYNAKDIKESKSVVRKILDFILVAYIAIDTTAYVVSGIPIIAIGALHVLLYAVFLIGGIFGYLALDTIIKGIEKVMNNTGKYSKQKALNVINQCKEIKEKSNTYIKESETFADSDDIKLLLKKYKTEQIKSDKKIKYYIKKIYIKDPSQIIDETPNFLSWIRLSFVLSTAAFNPIITIPIFIVDQFISMTFKREEAEKMVSYFEKELKKVESKDKSNKKIESYIKCLNKCVDKLKEYRDSLYSEREIEKRNELEESVNNYNNFLYLEELKEKTTYIKRDLNNIFKNTPLSIQKLIDVDLIDSFNESSILEFINKDSLLDLNIVTLNNNISYNEAERITENINNALSKDYVALLESDNDILSIHAIRKNKIVLNNKDKEDLEYTIPYELKNSFKSIINITNSTEDFILQNPEDLNNRIEENFDILMKDPIRSCRLISGCKDIIDKEYIINLIDKYKKEQNKLYDNNLELAKKELSKEYISFDENTKLLFMTESIRNINSIINEGVNINTLKTASLNLKKKATNLVTKEKEISRNVDITMSRLHRSVEKALTTDRREAIIKGSIIPSFSKMIKFAIAATGTYLISPTLAVIGVIGSLAISKSLTHRERKLLLDEIDVELKVVEKQISTCEDSNPNKYRQLLTYQRRLEREKMRIKYSLTKDRQVVPGVNIVNNKDD